MSSFNSTMRARVFARHPARLIGWSGMVGNSLLAASLLVILAVCASADTGHRDFPGLVLDTTSLPENFTILGQVVDSFNQLPVSGANVTFAGTITTTTDLDGAFEFRNIDSSVYAPGTYLLNVSHGGYDPVSTVTEIPPLSCILISLASNTVLLLHGILSDGDSWHEEWTPGESFFSFLTENAYNVVVPTFGLSCASLTTNASQLLFELKALHEEGIQSYSVIGHSAGGLVARYYLNSFSGLGNIGDRVIKLITLGTPHHGSPLASYSLGATSWWFRGMFCDQHTPIINELVPGNAILNLLNYGIKDQPGEAAPCSSHDPETWIGIDPTRVYCLVGNHPETNRTEMTSALLAAKYGCPNNDGVVPTHSAYLWGVSSQNQWLDEDLTFEGEPCATEHYLGPQAFKINPCIANAVKDILGGTPPAHSAFKSTAKSTVVRHQFPPTITRLFETGESLVDSSLVFGLSQAMFMCSWSTDSLDYYLETPSGLIITGLNSVGNPDVTWLADSYGAMYLIDSPESGMWKHRVICPPAGVPGTLQFTTSFDSELELSASVTPEVPPSDAFTCVALFTRSGLVLPTARVVAEVTMPDSGLVTLLLVDDGAGGDAIPGDGEYWGALPAAGQSGVFSFLVHAVEDSTQVFGEEREVQQVGMARNYSSIEVPSDEFVIGSQFPDYGSVVELASTFRNIGFAPADSVLLMIENMRYGKSLADTVVSLAPGESFTLRGSWMAASIDTTKFRAVAVVLEGDIDDDPLDNAAFSWARVSYPDGVVGVPDDPEVPPGDVTGSNRKVQIEIAPNPSNFGAEIRFVLVTPGPVKVSIYDLAGRLVRNLLQDDLERGEHRVRWDGFDRRGAPVSSGIYLCRLETARKMLVTKMAVVK